MSLMGQGQPCGPGRRRVRSYLNSGCARIRAATPASGQDPTLRRGRASEYAVNLGGHDEVVLMQSFDLLGLQRDRRIAPTEADIRMMAFSFREFTDLLDKGKRLPEIALRLANCEIAIAASQAMGGAAITAAAAPRWISCADLASATPTARALSASIARARIW